MQIVLALGNVLMYYQVMNSADNKTFTVETKSGKRIVVVIRQMPHDPQYKIGSRIPGYGKVVA